MKFKWDKAQRKFAAKHLMNGGYGALVALAFSQALAERVNPIMIALGLLIYLAGWYAAMKLTRGTG